MKPHTTTPARRIRRFAFASVLPALLLVFATLISPPLAAQSATGSIAGRVLDSSSGKYLEGATVALDGTPARTSSQRSGTFAFHGLAPGQYHVAVDYPGLQSSTETVTVTAGQTSDLVIRLSGADVVTLGEFRVQTSKEGMAQAVALQRVSIQAKLLAASDQFGPISEGNVGEYLKYLPGVGIDYNANDARGVSLRGLNTSFTVVAVDGTPMAASSSVADTRRFEFEQIAMNNVETTELFKTVTPDIPANATGGFVNFVTKSAFDTEEPSVLAYDVSLLGPTSNFSLGKKSGVWGDDKEFVIRPNVEVNYARRIGEKIGLNFNYRISERYDDSPRTEITYVTGGRTVAGDPASLYGAEISQYNIRTEQKITHREAFATKLDYHFTESTKLTLSGQWNWYNLRFHQRGPLFVLGNNALRSGDSDENASFTTTAPVIRNDVLFRNKYGTTWHFNGTFDHDFGTAGRAWITGYWSQADGQYRDVQKGFVGSTSQLNAGIITEFTLSGPLGQELPGITLRNGTSPVSLDAIRSLSNYSLNNTAANSTNVQARPWTTHENKTGVSGHYAVDIGGLPTPLKLQVGAAVDETDRDITRMQINGPFTITDLTPLRDEGFNKDVAFGFGSYQVVDPYKMAGAYAPRLTNVFVDLYREFQESNRAAYLRADWQAMPDLLVVAGFRWEEHQIEGLAQNRARATTPRTEIDLKYDRVYPSLTLKYTPAAMKNIVARAGASQTVGHPDYADLAPQIELGDGTVQSSISVPEPDLKPYYVKNYDVSVDYYLQNTGVIGLAAFRKDISDFIISRPMTAQERAAMATAYGYPGVNFTQGQIAANGVDSSVQGIEFSYAQTMSFLPAPFNGFSTQLNFTITKTEADDNDTYLNQRKGAAPKAANLIIGYRIGKWAFTSTTNWTAATVWSGAVNTEWSTGTANADPRLDTRMVAFKDDTTTTNLKAEYAFDRRFTAYILVQNIFKEGRDDYWRGWRDENKQINLPRNHYQFGEPYVSIGLRGRF